ncbi:unnamed protein product [Dracunculus medinensis]|uniref:F-box domain-containing protein n=1 Tax=Dracunculus medinensis TaxID=318479 RepID=A0A0N4UGM1_DRAME|nr:unnamed protein product [Dracunculus medinensis]
MFNALRRLHGHNLENQGLNDLSDAFQNFVTRARFFSIGRLRRTWSHSAVEFIKYRRLLPMLICDGQNLDQYDRMLIVFYSKKIIVTNISPRVTTNQLISFFSKFGKVNRRTFFLTIQLNSCLLRCGIHLKKLDLSGVVNLLDNSALEIVASFCPNLIELNISGIRAHWRALRTVGESLPKLESLIYKDMVNVTDKSLWYLFRVNGANIVSIDLRGCRRIKGYFLSLFGENLETVFIRLNHFVLITSSVSLLIFIFSLITRNMIELHSFSLSGSCFDSLTTTGLMTLTRLEYLTELS